MIKRYGFLLALCGAAAISQSAAAADVVIMSCVTPSGTQILSNVPCDELEKKYERQRVEEMQRRREEEDFQRRRDADRNQRERAAPAAPAVAPITCAEVALFTSAIALLRNRGYPLARAKTQLEADPNFTAQEKSVLKEMATIVYSKSTLTPSDHALLSSLACNMTRR